MALRVAVVVMLAATLGRSDWQAPLVGGAVVAGVFIFLGIVAGRAAIRCWWRYSGHAVVGIDVLCCAARFG